MARQIQAEGWSVRQTEHTVSEILSNEDGTSEDKPTRGKRSGPRTVTPQISSLEQELRRSLGTKIEIRQSTRGKVKLWCISTVPKSLKEFARFWCPKVGQQPKDALQVCVRSTTKLASGV